MNETATLLHNFGFPTKLAKSLADIAYGNGLSLANVQAWIDEARSSTSLTNPLGFVRARLQDGDKLPEEAPVDCHVTQRHRFHIQFHRAYPKSSNHLSVTTQTCTCGQVVWKDRICENCGLCPACCQCDLEDTHKE